MSSLNKRRVSYPEGSLTLAISAAEGRLLLALGLQTESGPELLVGQEWQASAQGVELLVPALQAALEGLKLTPRHIGRIAAVNGPGSFTGLRLSIVTAAGLARAIGCTQAALPYLPLLAAHSAQICQESGERRSLGEIWPVTHARRGLVHTQGFKLEKQELKPVSNILVLELEECVNLLQERKTTIFGSGVSKNRGFFTKELPKARILGPIFDQPSAIFLLDSALKAEYSANDISPIYARASDAEENLPQIAAKLGLDPDDAQKRLDELLAATPKNML